MFPEFAKILGIYEVNLRQYSQGGTFKEFALHLPRLKELGVGILWFMPIFPIGLKNRKGIMGSYYSIRNFTAVDPSYGTLAEFKELVRQIHSMGMYIVLDWVANHTSWDHHWTHEQPDFYHKDEKGDFKPPFPEWEDVIHLNYNNYFLRKEMTEAMKFWIRETGIDGYRCDMANLVPAGFWADAIKEIRKDKEIFMLAEAEERPLLDAGFDSLYNWRIFHLLNSVARHEQPIENLDGMIEWEFMEFPADKAHMHFTCNHDENSWNGSAIERLGHFLEPAIVLSFTLPGMPLIYSGQEAGLWKRLQFFDKDLIEWKEDKLRPLFTRLNELKRDQPALWNAEYGGNLRRIMHEESRDVMTFVREKNGSRVIVCINFSSDFKRFRLSHYAYQGMYEDYFLNHQVSLALDAGITLKPFEYKIFVK